MSIHLPMFFKKRKRKKEEEEQDEEGEKTAGVRPEIRIRDQMIKG
jgi:hypothetical protein